MTLPVEMVGRRFGKLVVLSRAGSTADGKATWNCACDCGGGALVRGTYLRSSHTTTCGCERGGFKPQAFHKSSSYISFRKMHERCGNPNAHNYAYYGGRGIKVCARWRSFDNFLADMGVRPAGHTLDRIDSNLGYEPSNCRWATRETQSQNRRKRAA